MSVCVGYVGFDVVDRGKVGKVRTAYYQKPLLRFYFQDSYRAQSKLIGPERRTGGKDSYSFVPSKSGRSDGQL